MPERVTATPVIRLARAQRRLLAAPFALLVAGAGAAVAGILVGGPAGIALLATAGLAALVAGYLLALVSSYRLQVEPGGLLLRWFGGQRRYRLVRGPVTRVAVSGEGAAALHPRFGALGWAVGPALLRGEEAIELIRLSTRTPLILVPTDRGRLAVAAEVESELLSALSVAVRMQEQIDEVASRRAAPVAAPVAALVAAATARPEPPAPRVLTGIERSLLEQRLAAEQAASLVAAETERSAAAEVVVPERAAPVPAAPPPPAAVERPRATGRRRERVSWQRPAWLAVPGPASVASALPIAVPLVGAGIAWIAVTVTGRPALPVPEARLLTLALILVGPLGAAGALLARVWYPRLGGLVAASSLAALAILARTILA